MKKLLIITAIVLGLGLTSFANPNGKGGLFQRGAIEKEDFRANLFPVLPIHDQHTHQNATPLGSGIMVLGALGAAYLIGKRRKEE